MFYKLSMYGFLKNLNFFEPFMMLFFLEKGFTFLQIGLLFAIEFITTNFLQIPTGIFADSIGRRRAMIISFLSYIVSFFMFFFASSYVALSWQCFFRLWRIVPLWHSQGHDFLVLADERVARPESPLLRQHPRVVPYRFRDFRP